MELIGFQIIAILVVSRQDLALIAKIRVDRDLMSIYSATELRLVLENKLMQYADTLDLRMNVDLDSFHMTSTEEWVKAEMLGVVS